MSAVGVLAGHDIRRRWRSTIAIALLVGVVGAVVLATAAGARRSDSSLSRFNAYSRSSDLEISVGLPTDRLIEEFRRAPGVETVSRLRAYALASEGQEELPIAAPLDGVIGHVTDRSLLIRGRRANPSSVDEITIGEGLAEQLHLRPGSTFPVQSFTQDQVTNAFNGAQPEKPLGPSVTLHVVGIVRRPLDLGVRAAVGGVVVLTPAFAREFDGKMGAFTDVLRVKTDSGPAGVAGVVAVARRMFGNEQTFGTQALGIETEGARNAIDVLTLALWIVAGVTALAGLVAISIVVTRDVARGDADQQTFSALGLTRGQRIAVNGPRALIIASGGALLAVFGAIALSPLFPIGVARRADPDTGFHADAMVLALGVLVVLAVVLLIALLAAARSARRATFEPTPGAYRGTSAVVERVAATGLRPSAVNGLRMAIQSGRGENAVPVRSAFVGAVFGVAGVTAALVFAASLSHLVATPRLYGWTWDVNGDRGTEQVCEDPNSYGLERAPGVEAVAVVCAADVQLDGRPVTAWGFLSLHGTIDPEVVSGRAPRGSDEIALGAVTLNELGKHIGDTVEARGGGKTRELEIVGRVVLPTIADPQPLADGATVTGAGFTPMYNEGENETDTLVVRLKPGADRAPIIRRFNDMQAIRIGTPTIPIEVGRLQQIDRIPASIAALLGVLALLAVGHALVTAVRRRRHELALLKVLGFDRRQVRATVAWQASTLGAVGLVIGIPAGIIIGRLVWTLVANSLGVASEVATPARWLLLSVPCVLVLVNLIAYFPGRSAARTRPAVALRTP